MRHEEQVLHDELKAMMERVNELTNLYSDMPYEDNLYSLGGLIDETMAAIGAFDPAQHAADLKEGE